MSTPLRGVLSNFLSSINIIKVSPLGDLEGFSEHVPLIKDNLPKSVNFKRKSYRQILLSYSRMFYKMLLLVYKTNEKRRTFFHFLQGCSFVE